MAAKHDFFESAVEETKTCETLSLTSKEISFMRDGVIAFITKNKLDNINMKFKNAAGNPRCSNYFVFGTLHWITSMCYQLHDEVENAGKTKKMPLHNTDFDLKLEVAYYLFFGVNEKLTKLKSMSEMKLESVNDHLKRVVPATLIDMRKGVHATGIDWMESRDESKPLNGTLRITLERRTLCDDLKEAGVPIPVKSSNLGAFGALADEETHKVKIDEKPVNNITEGILKMDENWADAIETTNKTSSIWNQVGTNGKVREAPPAPIETPKPVKQTISSAVEQKKRELEELRKRVAQAEREVEEARKKAEEEKKLALLAVEEAELLEKLENLRKMKSEI
jgi:hypothetical protein